MLVTIAGEDVDLLPDRAMFWRASSTLFIADPHFGKTAAFRAAGIAAPETVTQHDLARLDRLIAQTAPSRLVILGDFFHARGGRIPETEALIARWRSSHAELSVTLVRGNHDLHAGDPPDEWDIECVDPGAVLGPFVLCHAQEDRVSAEGYRLCGHLHPAVMLDDGSCMSPERLPCFLLDGGLGILPAFGRFTGMRALRPRPGQRVYAMGDGMVLEIPIVDQSASRMPDAKKEIARSGPKSRGSLSRGGPAV